MLFSSWSGLGRTLIVSVLAYASLIIVLRLSGKRSLSKLNAFDFVVTVALGSTLATVLLSKDVALAEALVAFASLLGLQWLAAMGSVKWHGFRDLLRSQPRLLAMDGRYIDSALAEERVTAAELDQTIRKHGIGRIEDVAAVVLETDGSFSVIPRTGDDGELTVLRSVRSS